MVAEAFDRKAAPVAIPEQSPEKYYGELVFNRQRMFEYLPKEVYDELLKAIENKTPISRRIADSVADGMRRWAVENGVVNGKSGGILDPKGLATRAEAAQMLKNFLNNE